MTDSFVIKKLKENGMDESGQKLVKFEKSKVKKGDNPMSTIGYLKDALSRLEQKVAEFDEKESSNSPRIGIAHDIINLCNEIKENAEIVGNYASANMMRDMNKSKVDKAPIGTDNKGIRRI
jgi:hypothetical protein